MLFKDLLPYLITTKPEGMGFSGMNASLLISSVFTPAFVLDSFHLLVDHLLPLTPNDLEQLELSPEEWLIQMESGDEAWQYELRVSTSPILLGS